MPTIGLDAHGITPSGEVHWNLQQRILIGHALRRGEGELSAHGAFVTETGERTGRSANDKFIVREPTSEGQIWWGDVNVPTTSEVFVKLRQRVTEYLDGRPELFVQDLFCGAEPKERLAVRVVSENAWHSAFARNMFLRPPRQNSLGMSRDLLCFTHLT
jgi:phosphoenolpyruvate carboxykinase (ATP)